MKVCSFCHRCYEDAAVSCTVEDHPPLSETRKGDPEMIAGFRIERSVESGLRGEIYLARQTECGKACLIRIVNPDGATKDDFLREAKLAATIFHANVADVYDAGVLATGEAFVVAEDAELETLRERIDAGVPIDLLTAIRIIRQAAEAVHALHLKGLMHRAVRPENIVLIQTADAQPLVKVQNPDLGGLAQHAVISNKFFIDSALDSLRYFAPEQCAGEEACTQTDVYGLGIVFYEMLAGLPPFDADNATALIEKHKSEPPPDIKINNFDLRMLVTHTLKESLQKQSQFRQSSANAFARQLRHIEQLATHMATPPPAGIVPPAPRRSAPRVSVAIDAATSASIAPSVTIESPVTARTERAPAVAATFQEEPIPVVALESRESFDELRADIVEHLSIKSVVENLVETETIESVPKRSRMKLHRKRSQIKPAPVAFEMPEVRHVPIVETASPVEAAVEELQAATPTTDEKVLVHFEPTRVEWEQPEEDIPSVEDVMEVLHLGPVVAMPVCEAEEIAVERTEPEEKPVIVEMGEAVALAHPELLAVLEEIRPVVEEPLVLVEHTPEPVKIAAAPIARRAEPKRVEAKIEEQEEITLVRAPGNRIKIDLDKRLWKKFSAGSSQPLFVPTILGDGKHGAIDPDTRDSIFADYSDKPRPRVVTGRRVAAIGAPIALIVMFLFGNDLVTKYLQARSSDEAAAVKTADTAKTTPPARKPESTRRAAKKPRPNPVERATADTKRAPRLEPAAEIAKPKPKTKLEPKAAGKKPPSTPNNPARMTRPRIVQNPKS